MEWILIDGCDFNTVVAALTLEGFKKEFEHSYCIGKTDAQIKKTYNQIKEAIGNSKADAGEA